MMKQIIRQYGLWQARRRGKAAAIRDWNSRLHLKGMVDFEDPTPESDKLMRDYIVDGISWLDLKDRGQL